MKYLRCLWVVAAVMLLMPIAGNATATASKRVLVVLSADSELNGEITESKWIEGFKEVMGPGVGYDFLFAGLEDLTSPDDLESKGLEMAAEAKKRKPDLIISLGNLAVKHVAVHIDEIPVVFAFVYGNIKTMGLPRPNITGVVRRSFAPDIWGLAHQLTGATRVAMLSKKSFAMGAVRHMIMAEADRLEAVTKVRLLDMYLLDSFAEWAAKVNAPPADFFYLADTTNIKKGDQTIMSVDELVQWTVDHSKVPVIAATQRDVKAGALFSVVIAERELGMQIGSMSRKILDGTPVSDIPIEKVKKGAFVFNVKTAKKYNLEIPYEILSVAEKVYE